MWSVRPTKSNREPEPSVDSFLSSLRRKPESPAEKAFASSYINSNFDQIGNYLSELRTRGLEGIELSRKYQELVTRYRESPRGVYFDPLTAVVKFDNPMLSERKKEKRILGSMEPVNYHRTAKVCGVALAIVLAGLAGRVLYQEYGILKDLVELKINQIQAEDKIESANAKINPRLEKLWLK